MFEAGHGRLLPSSGFFLVESLLIVGAVFVKCCHINKLVSKVSALCDLRTCFYF